MWTSQGQIHLHYKRYTLIYNRISPPSGLTDISHFYTKNKAIILEYLLPQANTVYIGKEMVKPFPCQYTDCNADVINPVANNFSLYVSSPEFLFILKLSEYVLSCMEE